MKDNRSLVRALWKPHVVLFGAGIDPYMCAIPFTQLAARDMALCDLHVRVA